MNKKLTVIFAGIFISVFSIAAISAAQTMKNEGLNAKQEKIVTIAAFTAKGDLQKLKTALNEGLDAGLTINEIKEVLVQMYAYAGFPRSLNGINAFIGVLEEREKKGIKDELGKEANPLPTDKSSIELGTEIQTRLIGAPATGKYIIFVPAEAYIGLMAEWCSRSGVAVWAYCRMPNHVHLIVVPGSEGGLRSAIGEAYRRYSGRLNFREGWRGHPCQGRFASYPMNEPYLLAAVRHVELNPTRARLVECPGAYPRSSAAAHLTGRDDAVPKTRSERLGERRSKISMVSPESRGVPGIRQERSNRYQGIVNGNLPPNETTPSSKHQAACNRADSQGPRCATNEPQRHDMRVQSMCQE